MPYTFLRLFVKYLTLRSGSFNSFTSFSLEVQSLAGKLRQSSFTRLSKVFMSFIPDDLLQVISGVVDVASGLVPRNGIVNVVGTFRIQFRSGAMMSEESTSPNALGRVGY